MFSKCIILALFVCVINETNAKCKAGQDEKICWVVRCANVETCDPGTHLVLRNPQECVCCNYCAADKEKDDPPSKCKPGQNPEMCNLYDCMPYVNCTNGQHLVKRDTSKCICCDYCENNTNTSEEVPNQCKNGKTPNICAATQCLRVDSCPCDQKLIPADISKCICCSFCKLPSSA